MRTAFIIVLSVLIVLALEAVYYAVRYVSRRRSEELRRRLKSLGDAPEGESLLLRRGRLAKTSFIAGVLRGIPLAQRTEALLEAADSRLTVAQLWGYSLALLVAAIVLVVALGLAPVAALVVLVVPPSLPAALVVVAAGQRSRKISEQLPEALDMMARSLRAGHAVPAALQMVATEMPEPVSVEFGRAFEEQRLGLPLEEAIAHMTLRSPNNHDLKIFATSTVIQRQTGGNLAELLAGLGETIRARYRFQGKLRALTAEGRASGIVLGLLPLGFAAVLQVMNPKYLVPLMEDRTGNAILLYALISWVLGVMWLTKLSNVDI